MTDDNRNSGAESSSQHKVFTRSDVRKPALEGLLYLYQVKLADGQIARLYPDDVKSMSVTFGGLKYHAHPIEAEGFSWEPGQLTNSPLLRLSTHDLSLQFDPAIDNVRGGTCERIITFVSECEPPIGEGGGSAFPSEMWQIDRLERLDGQTIQLALAPAANLDGQFLPKRVMLRDICQHRYRRWDKAKSAFDYEDATCPYMGSDYFTQTGAPTNDPARDGCSLRMKDGCKKRFFGDLPFFAFPGLAR